MTQFHSNIEELELKNRLVEYLGDRSDKYYVYVLYDGNEPFYVGKGEGTRVFSHEEELSACLNEMLVDCEDEEQEEQARREYSRKLERIQRAKNNNSFKRVIIKHGLSEYEAFMVESAVMNSLRYTGFELTNIMNGHSSNKERKSDCNLEAYEVSSFVNNYAPEKFDIHDISQEILQESIFINITETYKKCRENNIEDLWDAVRGNWRLGVNVANEIRYIFVISRNIVRGIFEIASGNVMNVIDNPEGTTTGPNNMRIEEHDLYVGIHNLVDGGPITAEVHQNHSLDRFRRSDLMKLDKFLRLREFKYFSQRVNDECALTRQIRDSFENKYISGLKFNQGSFIYGARFIED